MKYKYFDNHNKKIIRSENYNMFFNKNDGTCITYGKTKEDDVDLCPFGPLILDIEISSQCFGIGGKVCDFCYKCATPNGSCMSFETFKTVFDKLPNTVTQIAFGTSSCATVNKDIWNMFSYCRENGVVPNLTVADISPETAENIHKYCGACAVSRYSEKDYCYDSVKKLTDLGMTQINIHQMISEETFNQTMETIDDIKTDNRLSKLNAIVFLSLKKKGRGINFTPLSSDRFDQLIKACESLEISYGMDSCSGNKFSNYCKKNNKEDLLKYVCGCESCKESFYISEEGIGYPCSFNEKEGEWKEGIDMINIKDFVNDVWYDEKIVKFRNSVNNDFSKCPTFKV